VTRCNQISTLMNHIARPRPCRSVAQQPRTVGLRFPPLEPSSGSGASHLKAVS